MDAFGDQFCHPLGMGGKRKLSRAFCGSQKLTKMDLEIYFYIVLANKVGSAGQLSHQGITSEWQ